MHRAAPYRKTLTLSVLVMSLIPIVTWVFSAVLRKGTLPLLTHPVAIGAGLGVLVVILGLIVWKRTALMPELIFVPCIAFAICEAAGVFDQSRQRTLANSTEKKQGQFLSIRGNFDDVEVWCNGVKIGVTPLKMPLDEFHEMVEPVDAPPDQNVMVTTRGSVQFGYAQFGAVPYDPGADRPQRLETNGAIMSHFANQKYWWTLRHGDHNSLLDLHWDGSAYEHYERQWPGLQRHATVVQTLAKHEGVDPLVAYAEHVDQQPALADVLKPKAVKELQPTQTWAQQRLEELPSYASETFEEAVWNMDWLAIARSDNPRSGPLLEWYLDQTEKRFSDGSVLTFRKEVVAVLMESRQPQVQTRLRELLAHANFSHIDLLDHYIDQQLRFGADRNELTTWLGTIKSSLHNDADRLLLKIGGDNMGDHLESSSWAFRNIPTELRRNAPPAFLQWLAQQWRKNPSRDIMSEMCCHATKPSMYKVMAETDLSSVEKADDFLQIMITGVDGARQPFVEAAANAFQNATDPAHHKKLATIMWRLPAETSLKVLEDYDGPESEYIAKAAKGITEILNRRKASFEADLQLARDLIAGRKTPADLQYTQRFVWQDGRYVLAK